MLGLAAIERYIQLPTRKGTVVSMVEAPLLSFLGAVVVNLIATPYIIRMLRHRAVLDIPNERSSHQTPVPRGGGILIVASILATTLLLVPQPITAA